MKLYEDPQVYALLTPPSDYEEEAAVYLGHFRRHLGADRFALLELGCGPGHNALWLQGVDLTLTDLSAVMLARAAENNPEATCVQGDMRTLRLGRTFDAVFAHDAICHLPTLADVRAMVATVVAHLRPGGGVLLVPDYTTESFAPDTEVGGTDGGGASVRYLAQMWQREGETDRYIVDYVVTHRVGDALPTVTQDRHVEGLFSRQDWLDAMRAAGLDARVVDMGGIGDDTAFWGVLPV